MSKFVLTAQLQLQAPNNVGKVLGQVRKQLSGAKIPVEVEGAKQAQDSIKKITAETNKAATAANAMGKSFGLAIKRFAAFTVASRAVSLLTNNLAKAVDEAIDFQREIVKVSQVTGKAVKDLKGLQNTITSLATGLGTSSKDLLAVTRILSQAGIKANDLETALKALAKTTLAPTFDDITETAEGAVAILSQFGAGVEKLEQQLGAINAVAGQFAVESGDLIGAVRRFGGVFQAAGGELEELLAVFTAVRATTRESAESISTGLRTIFTRIQRPKTIEFLRQFGVELETVDGKFVGPFEAAKKLSKALAGLGKGDLEFVQIAEELGGFRQIGKVIPLLQQFETAERARQAALAGGESLTKDSTTAQQALAVQITKVKEEFLALVRSFSESTSFQLFAKVALEIASNLIKIVDTIKPLLPLITALAAIKISKSLGDFLGGAGSAVRGLQSFDPQKKNLGGKIQAFARGGFVPGTGNRDTVPAMLTPGEFVIKKSSASKLGAGTLQAMNQNRYNKGGRIADITGKFGLSTPDGAVGSLKEQDVLISSLDSKAQDRLRKKINLTGEQFTIGGQSQNRSGRDQVLKFFKENSGSTLLKEANSNAQGWLSEFGGLPKTSKKGASLQNTTINAIKAQFRKRGELISGAFPPKSTIVASGGTSDSFSSTANNLFNNVLDKKIPEAFTEAVQSFPTPLGGPDNVPLDKLLEKNIVESFKGNMFEAFVRRATNTEAGKSGELFDFPEPVEGFNQLFNKAVFPNEFKNAFNKSNLASTYTKALKYNDLSVKKLASGGGVGGGQDNVPALLTPGEFVVNKKAAQSIGYGNLNSMNKSGVARFNAGGLVGFQKFENGGSVTAKGIKAEIQIGQAGLTQEIAGLSKDIGAQRKVVQAATQEAERLSQQEADLAKRSADLSSAVGRLEQQAVPGAKGQKALNRIYSEIEKVETERLKASQEATAALGNLNDVEEQLADLEQAKADKIAQAKTQKEVATSALQDTLQTGTPAGEFKKSKVAKIQREQDAKKKRDAGIREATDDGATLKKFQAGLLATNTALGLLKPTIDESSSSFERVAASLIDSTQKMVNGIFFVITALQALGVKLNLKGIGSVLRGKGGGADALSDAISGKFKGAGKAIDGFGKNLAGKGGMLGKLGKGISSLGKGVGGMGPAVGGATVALAGVAAAGAAAVAVVYAAVKAIDAYTKVHEKAKEAVETGDVEGAGDAAVASANAKVANKAALGTAAATTALGAAIGSVVPGIGTLAGAIIGAIVGVFAGIGVKILSQFEFGQDLINAFRDNILAPLGGDSTKTIKLGAEAAAARARADKNAAIESRKAATALQQVASGAKTLDEAFQSGALTGNFENELVAVQKARALQQSKEADIAGRLTGAQKGALYGSLLGPAGAIAGAGIGAVFDDGGEADRKAALKERVEAEEKGAQAFSSAVSGVFADVARQRALSGGGSPEDIKKSLRQDNKALDLELKQAEETKKQLEGIKQRRKLTEDEKRLLSISQGKLDQFNANIDGAAKAGERQRKLIEALNFGLAGVADQLGAAANSIANIRSFDQAGARFDKSINDLNSAFNAAAKGLTDKELDSALSDVERTLKESGVSQSIIDQNMQSVRGFATANKRLQNDSPELQQIRKDIIASGGGLDAIKEAVAKNLTVGLDPEAADKIKTAIESAEFEGADLARLKGGDVSVLRETLDKVGQELNKGLSEILKQRKEIELQLIGAIQDRKQAEQEFVAAQRKAIDLQLEAGRAFQDFGGAALTPEQRRGANLAKFNVGAGFAGIQGLQSGSASDIQRVSAQISSQFMALESGAQVAAGNRQAFGAGLGAEGAESDKRQQLKQLQQDLIVTTKQEIAAKKEELDLIRKKNAAEKSSLEKLLEGDVEGFLEGQQTAGAAAALRSGDSGLANLFSASALGQGLQSLQGTGESAATLNRAGQLALGSVGITDSRAAGVLTGTTAEERAKMGEGQELARTLGALGQQAAEFERAEIFTKQVVINDAQVMLQEKDLAIQRATNKANGGMIYASMGMFVPRGTDTVPAMLTPGEFVVNRSAVNRGNNLQILRAMNSGGGASGPGRMSGGGQVQYYNLGGIVEGIGSALTSAIPGLQGVFTGFTDAVDKLVNSQFSVKLDTTNVNVNFNGGSFLSSMKEDIKNELLKEVQNEIGKFKPNTNGDLQKTDSVLGS
tara:strand:+ start:6649 stop:13197 length:6549 start_codon:yes stop_codon:yes gene_type:complete